MKQIPQINIVRSGRSIDIYYYLPEKIMGLGSGGKNIRATKTSVLKTLHNYSTEEIYLGSTLEIAGLSKEELEKYNGYRVLKKKRLKSVFNFLKNKRKDITFKLAA